MRKIESATDDFRKGLTKKETLSRSDGKPKKPREKAEETYDKMEFP